MRKVLPIFLALSILSSCSPALKLQNIVLNEEKETFEYKVNKNASVPLRNSDMSLVDKDSYNDFIQEFQEYKNEYPFGDRSESELMLKRSDFEIASLYTDANTYLKKKAYSSALEKLTLLHSLYPQINLYSNYSFLKGYSYDKLEQKDSADYFYKDFLNYGSQRYSARFHGNRYTDLNDEAYIEERNFAKDRLENHTPSTTFKHARIQPKYYYGSHIPGYTLNTEDNPPHAKGQFLFFFADGYNSLALGGQMFWQFNKTFGANFRAMGGPGYTETALAIPVQVVRTDNNKFGMKITPFVELRTIKYVSENNESYRINAFWPTFGARVSAGYYPMPKLVIGAYFHYAYHNAANPYQADLGQELILNNEYDISAYYLLTKGISLKLGVKNNDVVAGFFFSGWELSYNVTSPGLLARVNLY